MVAGFDRQQISRRDLVMSGVGIAIGAASVGATLRPTAAPAVRHQPFAYGVASGDPLPDAVVLWTRVSPSPEARPGSGRGAPAEVIWQVATDDSFSDRKSVV